MWECVIDSYYDEIDNYDSMENEYYIELEENRYYEMLASETKEHEKQTLENEKEIQIYYELLKNGQFKSHQCNDDFEQLIA